MFNKAVSIIVLLAFVMTNPVYGMPAQYKTDTLRAPNLRHNDAAQRKLGKELGAEGSLDSERLGSVKLAFRSRFGDEPEVIAIAPGRDTVQGEHVDYPDEQFPHTHLYSMGGAIQKNFIAALRLRRDKTVRIIHLDAKEEFEFSLDEIKDLEQAAVRKREGRPRAKDREIPVWANHTLGVLAEALKKGFKLTGMDILLTSNVPYGAGLSNSAANCIAVTMALNDVYSMSLKTEDVITLARAGEHHPFVGSTCGWLDQLLSVHSKEGQFAMIDYADRSIRYFKSSLPETLQRVLVNTNIPRELAGTEYNHRNLAELPLAYETLRQLLPQREIYGSTSLTLGEINYLIRIFDPEAPEVDLREAGIEGMVSTEEAEQIMSYENLPDEKWVLNRFKTIGYEKPFDEKGRIIFRHTDLTPEESFALCLRRMRHQLTSGLRTPLTGIAAENGDVEAFGELINAEGESLRMSGDFQITGENGAQDALLDIGFKVGQELGIAVFGRMEGGGGGGEVGFYVDRTDPKRYQEWIKKVSAKYKEWAKSQEDLMGRGIEAAFIESKLSQGARVIRNKGNILITGGAGYIGSHTVRELLRQGYDVVVLDSLVKGREFAVERNRELAQELGRNFVFEQGDLSDEEFLREVFRRNNIDSVIHFAAFIEVGESVHYPALYFYNNIINTAHLLDAMKKAGIKRIIFSSSAAVYGIPDKIPITEDAPAAPISPYGYTKLAMERMIAHYQKQFGMEWIALRYFNASGASLDGQLGESHFPESHLIPNAIDRLSRGEEMGVYGTDYKTRDGTCLRDYISVEDLARAHILALEAEADIINRPYNLGTGSGFTVKEVVEETGDVLGVKARWYDAGKRTGDPDELLASLDAFQQATGWQPDSVDIRTIIGTAEAWHRNKPEEANQPKPLPEISEKVLAEKIEQELAENEVIPQELKDEIIQTLRAYRNPADSRLRLKELLRYWENYKLNEAEIKRLVLELLGIDSPEEFRPKRPTRVIVPAAGLGVRMGETRCKVLYPVCGRPIIYHVLDTLKRFDERPVVVVRADEWIDAEGNKGEGGTYQEVKQVLEKGGYNAEYVFQSYLKGDGAAVLEAKRLLEDFDGDVIVVWGDMAVLNPETVLWLTMIHQALEDTPFSIAATVKDETYAPILTDKDGKVIGSKKGLKTYGLDDVGVFIGRAKDIFWALENLPKVETSNPDNPYDYYNPYDNSPNKKGEMNFVQISTVLAKEIGEVIAAPLADVREYQGVNSPEEAERAQQYRIEMGMEAIPPAGPQNIRFETPAEVINIYSAA